MILGHVAQDQAVQGGRVLTVNGMLGAGLECVLQLGFLNFNLFYDLSKSF